MSEDLGVFRALSFKILVSDAKTMGVKIGTKFSLAIKHGKIYEELICTKKEKVGKDYRITAERQFKS